MANYEPILGMQTLGGTLQAPLSTISKAVETIAEELAVDPALPVLGELMTDGRITYVVIPKFRAVGIKRRTGTTNNAGTRPTITLAGPTASDPDPVGVAQFDLYKEFTNMPQGMMSVFEKRQYIRFPFVNGTAGAELGFYNSNANGDLFEGAQIAPDVYGRPVLYYPEERISVVAKAGATDTIVTVLTSKNRNIPISGLQIMNVTKGTDVTAEAILTAPVNGINDGDATGWGTTTGKTDKYYVLVDVDATAVAQNDILIVTVVYGHKPQKRYATVGRLVCGVDPDNFGKWITQSINNNFPFAPMMNPVFAANAEVIIQASAGTGILAGLSNNVTEITLGQQYVDVTRPFSVEWTADYTADTPTWTTLQNAAMDRMYVEQQVGPEFAIHAVSGVLQLFLDATAHPVTATSALRVRYSYKIAQPRGSFEMGSMGALDTGIYRLTDGSVPGTVPGMKISPAVHPDGAGFRTNSTDSAFIRRSGVMHLMID